jgi:hypothetical protein
VSASGWETYLQPGEKLLWEGAPKPGVHGKGKIIGLALFGLPFLIIGISVAVEGITQVSASESWRGIGLGLFFIAFAVPFTGIGALMVFGQWYAAHEAHRKLRYALSNRAAYIARTYWSRSIASYPILKSAPTGLEKGRTADTVWFHVQSETNSDGDRSFTRIGFDNIADGDAVFRLIRSIQTGSA